MWTAHKEAVSGCDAQIRCPQKGGKAEPGQIDRLPSTGKTSQMDSFPAKYGCRFFGQNRLYLNKVFASLFDLIRTILYVFYNVVMWPCCWLNWQSQSDTGHNSQFLPNVSSDKVTGPKILAISFSHLSSGSFIGTTNLKCWKSPSEPPSCISQREGVGRSVLDLRFKLDSMLTQPTSGLLWEESSKKNTGIFHRHRQHICIHKFFAWSKKSAYPLKYYSGGLWN